MEKNKWTKPFLSDGEGDFRARLAFSNKIAGKYRCARRAKGFPALLFLKALNGTAWRGKKAGSTTSVINTIFHIHLYLRLFDRQMRVFMNLPSESRGLHAVIYQYLLNSCRRLSGPEPLLIQDFAGKTPKGWNKRDLSMFTASPALFTEQVCWNDPAKMSFWEAAGIGTEGQAFFYYKKNLPAGNSGRINTGLPEEEGHPPHFEGNKAFNLTFVLGSPHHVRKTDETLLRVLSDAAGLMSGARRVKTYISGSQAPSGLVTRGSIGGIIHTLEERIKNNEMTARSDRFESLPGALPAGHRDKIKSHFPRSNTVAFEGGADSYVKNVYRAVMKGSSPAFPDGRQGVMPTLKPSGTISPADGGKSDRYNSGPGGTKGGEDNKTAGLPALNPSGQGTFRKTGNSSAGPNPFSDETADAANGYPVYGYGFDPSFKYGNRWNVSERLILGNHPHLSFFSNLRRNQAPEGTGSYSYDAYPVTGAGSRFLSRSFSTTSVAGRDEKVSLFFRAFRPGVQKTLPKIINNYYSVAQDEKRKGSFSAALSPSDKKRDTRLVSLLSHRGSGAGKTSGSDSSLFFSPEGEKRVFVPTVSLVFRPISRQGNVAKYFRTLNQGGTSTGMHAGFGGTMIRPLFAGTAVNPVQKCEAIISGDRVGLEISGTVGHNAGHYSFGGHLDKHSFNYNSIIPANRRRLTALDKGTVDGGIFTDGTMENTFGPPVYLKRGLDAVSRGMEPPGRAGYGFRHDFPGSYPARHSTGNDSSIFLLYGDEKPETEGLSRPLSYRRMERNIPPIDFVKKKTQSLTAAPVQHPGENPAVAPVTHTTGTFAGSAAPTGGEKSVNISRLADRVYREIEKRITIEKDRRGLI